MKSKKLFKSLISGLILGSAFVVYLHLSQEDAYAYVKKPNNCSTTSSSWCYEFVNQYNCLSDPEPGSTHNCD